MTAQSPAPQRQPSPPYAGAADSGAAQTAARASDQAAEPLKLAGLDHVVIAVTDLDRAAADWAALGFTLSPRGVHSAHMGTVNHTVMLGRDYLELLGVAQATDGNRSTRAFLERRGEGIERLAMRSLDAVRDAASLRQRGLAAVGPVEFSRPVSRADGSTTEAAFSVYYWPDDARVAEMRLFACQHHTPDAVWLPELQGHANGATRILRIEQYVTDPAADARMLGALVGIAPRPLAATASTPAGWRIATAPGHADIDFLAAGNHAVRVRLVIASDSAAAIAREPCNANGITLVFEALEARQAA